MNRLGKLVSATLVFGAYLASAALVGWFLWFLLTGEPTR